MRRMLAVCVVLVVLSGISAAQTPSQMPAPGPEQKRLQYYVGTWTSEYELKPGAMGPGGKMITTGKTQLLPGGFFAVTHAEGKGALGELKELAIMGYDSGEKVYTYDAYNNFGEADHFKGSVQGDTWTWTSDPKRPVKMRFTAKIVSPTLYTMTLEMATDGGWTTIMEGKATKEK